MQQLQSSKTTKQHNNKIHLQLFLEGPEPGIFSHPAPQIVYGQTFRVFQVILGSKAEAPLLLRQCGYGGGGDASSGWRVGFFCFFFGVFFFNFWLIGGGDFCWKMDEKKVFLQRWVMEMSLIFHLVHQSHHIQFWRSSVWLWEQRKQSQVAFWVTFKSEFVFHFARR